MGHRSVEHRDMDTIKQRYIGLKWHQKIAYNLMWSLCWITSYTPRFLRYGLLRPLITVDSIFTEITPFDVELRLNTVYPEGF